MQKTSADAEVFFVHFSVKCVTGVNVFFYYKSILLFDLYKKRYIWVVNFVVKECL